MNAELQRQSGWLNRFPAVGICLTFILIAYAFYSNQNRTALTEANAVRAFEARRYEQTLRICDALLQGNSGDSSVIAFLAGQAARELEKELLAVEYFDRVPDESEKSLKARVAAGELLLEKFRLNDAERRFRQAIAIDPESIEANEFLAFLYGMTSQRQQQIPFRLRLIREGIFQPSQLVSLALGDDSLENPDLAITFSEKSPRDPAIMITLARIANEEQRYDQANDLLEAAVNLNPSLMSAQVRLGMQLVEQRRWDDFLNWHLQLPPSADRDAGVWRLRGDYAREHISQQHAARCFAEAVRIDPNDPHTNYQLGQILGNIGHTDGNVFLKRARQLAVYSNAAKSAQASHSSQACQQAAFAAAALGLVFENYAWNLLAIQLNQDPNESARLQSRIAQLEVELPSLPLQRCPPAKNPAKSLAITSFPLPEFPSQIVASSEQLTRGVVDASGIRFEDDASRVRLDFQYFNGRSSFDTGLEKMFEFTGGGVAVLDFDCDSYPDLFFPQGCDWPSGESSTPYHDCLFQSRGDEFRERANVAGLTELDFGQGAAVGDFNNDGLSDLFVTNIGKNRLYCNNGDGTFSDVTGEAGLDGEQWSTSAAFADLNQDSLPDLYVANYLQGDDIFSRTCGTHDAPRICLPQVFEAAQDQVWLSQGDGTFKDITSSSGILSEPGKGLGIVVADLDQSRRLSIYVANDTTPNALFASSISASNLLLNDTAVTSGVAFNRDGKAEAGMGIAVGDADADGQFDLFVTNFSGESNTLYRQTSTGLFEDATLSMGLHHASLPFVTFGTQFIDVDLNSTLDLMTTSGHIDKFDHHRFQMPPQLFLNNGHGHFQSLEAESLGEYFGRTYLGRGLASLDWNRDGKTDVVVTHLDQPVALLTNTSDQVGHFVKIQLKGKQSPRDPTGAIVHAVFSDTKCVRQLTAGDGYLCSNERQIVVGIGAATVIDTLRVDWPSGVSENFQSVPANSHFLLVEGEGALRSLPTVSR